MVCDKSSSMTNNKYKADAEKEIKDYRNMRHKDTKQIALESSEDTEKTIVKSKEKDIYKDNDSGNKSDKYTLEKNEKKHNTEENLNTNNSKEKLSESESSDISNITNEGAVLSKRSMSELQHRKTEKKINRRHSSIKQGSSCSFHEDTALSKNSISLNDLNIAIKTESGLLDDKIRKTNQHLSKSFKKQNSEKNKKIIEKKQKNDLEITRMKLISYLGDRINETPLEEIEEAISKMLFLSSSQFENLLSDILDQIEKRTLNSSERNDSHSFLGTSKSSDSKLNNLSTRQFKKLCLDVFYVFEAKYPSDKANKYVSLIKNLEVSINEITNKMELLDETNVILLNVEREKCPTTQLNIFLEHLKKLFLVHNLDSKLIFKFQKFFLKNLENENMVLNILDPNFILKATEDSSNMKVQSQRKTVLKLLKKVKKSSDKSEKLDNPYVYMLRNEVVNLILLLEIRKPSFKVIIKNLLDLFDHLTVCYLNDEDIFTEEAMIIFNSVITELNEIDMLKQTVMVEFLEFKEFKEKVENQKLSLLVMNDEMERLIVNVGRKISKLEDSCID
ncbi:hypothetical protein CDIK_1806 [Cucumispora dikerogammari]|nr:hypothetical protein CDIK_1806 [Cucumispora dikerogammari]